MTDRERRQALDAIAAEIRVCTNCRLHQTRTNAVPGEGDPETEVVFVGEGPGEQEDRQGRPFVGASGQFLEELIGSVGWRRDEVFITNVVKCRPPDNRDPWPDEIQACSGYLRRQLEVLDPAVVVTAGKFSLNTFRPGERISRVHGTTAPADSATGAGGAVVFAMYHPAFALYQSSNRQTLIDDIAQLPLALLESRRRRDEAVTAPTNVVTGSSADAPGLAPVEQPEVDLPISEPASEAATGALAAQEQPPVSVDAPTPQLTLF